MIEFENDICPFCKGELKKFDSVKRLVKGDYGNKQWVIINRFMCLECGKIHRLIPEYLLPYKHYRRDIIQRFLDDDSDVLELEYEDYPCDSIKNKWRRAQKLHPFL